MGQNINAHCAICDKGYHVCKSCLEQQTFKPWRAIVDSVEHYKIYLALHGYTLSRDKDRAREELNNCDLSGLEEFKPEVKKAIKEILTDKKKVKNATKRTQAEFLNEDLTEDSSVEILTEE